MSTGKRNKQRGYELEAELVKQAKAEGLDSVRAWCSDGRSLGWSADVDLTVDVYKIQAKRRKTLPAYLQIPAGCDAVAFRQDRGEALVLTRWTDYLHTIKQLKEQA